MKLMLQKKSGGSIPVGDDSSPVLIQEEFLLTKSVFKKAVGTLLKKNLVEVEPHLLKLITKSSEPEKKSAVSTKKTPVLSRGKFKQSQRVTDDFIGSQFLSPEQRRRKSLWDLEKVKELSANLPKLGALPDRKEQRFSDDQPASKPASKSTFRPTVKSPSEKKGKK
jgi:hypothetical protein